MLVWTYLDLTRTRYASKSDRYSELLESKKMNPVTAKQNIHAIIADDNLAEKLEVKPGSAILLVERRGG